MFDLDKLTRKNIKALKPYSSARDEFSGKEGAFFESPKLISIQFDRDRDND